MIIAVVVPGTGSWHASNVCKVEGSQEKVCVRNGSKSVVAVAVGLLIA